MKKRILAIVEPKKEYAELFLGFLKDKKDFIFQTCIFTKEEALECFLEKEEIHVLLMSDTCNLEKWRKKVKLLIALSEGRTVQEEGKFPVIYKFQSAECILQEVYEAYTKYCEDGGKSYLPSHGKFSRQVCVFSPYGGIGKTTVSMVLAYLLGQGKMGTPRKTLVINLEPFSKQYPWLEEKQKKGFTEVIYYCLQERPDFAVKLQSLVKNMGGFDYLPSVTHYLDLEQLLPEQMEQILWKLQEETAYEVMIYDLSFLGKSLWKVVEHCDLIYTPILEGQQEKWWEEFSESEQELLQKKLRLLQIPRLDQVENLEVAAYSEMGKYITEKWKEEVSYGAIAKKNTETGFGKDFVFGSHFG